MATAKHAADTPYDHCKRTQGICDTKAFDKAERPTRVLMLCPYNHNYVFAAMQRAEEAGKCTSSTR